MRFSYRRNADAEHTVEVEVELLEGRENDYRVTVGEQVFELSARLFHRAAFMQQGGEITLQYEGREYRLFDASKPRTAPGRAGDLQAPMAGKVIQVCVQPGDQVKAGDLLLILESMKMEQQLLAPHAGEVAQVRCREGDQVTAGMDLVVLTAPEETARP